MKALQRALPWLLILPLAEAQNPAGAPGAGQDVPPIQSEGDYYILNFSESTDPSERISLEQFVKLCQEATGLNFTYNPATQQQLASGQVVMFGSKRIPKKDFYPFFQIQMFIHDFVCVEVGPPHISVILIQSLSGANQRGAANIKQRSRHITPEELENFADQPATLITTVLNLPNTDVRQLSTSLRGLLTDTNTQTLIAAGEHSVILQGFGSYVASLAKLLYIVDRESAITDEIQPVFDLIPLEYAAAEDVADLIEQLLESQQRRRTGQGRRPAQEGQGVSGALAGGDFETKILVDGRTNSLLLMALPLELPRIKDLIARLDVDVIQPERNFHVYSLENVRAEELSEVLDQFLSDAERLAGTTQGGTGGQARQGGAQGAGRSARTSNEVIVVPDNNANALLIAANKTRYEEVLELIRQLDRRQDQVLIETALIELTGRTLLDIGVEWALADIDEGFGVTNFGLSQLQDLDLDGIPDTRVPNNFTGVTAGILDGGDVNLPFLISASEQSEDVNILNVPSVLVNNNGTARVTTVNETPTTTITATGGVGGQTQENFRAYEEAGIEMQISPSISASHYLRLDISLIISNFTGTFVPGSAIPPPRTRREIITSVNVPDGDTMVIGGVVIDVVNDTRDAVPWIGNLPIIGALFRRNTDSQDRTTLYFFVTPHILHDRDFADLAEITYKKKLEAAETIGQDRVRVVDPEFGVAPDEVDFQSFEVPLYRSPERGEVGAEVIGLDPEQRAEILRQAQNGNGADDGEDE